MIRVAAVGDVHYDSRSRPEFADHFAGLSSRADLLLISGDLTKSGKVEEAEALARDLESATVPVALVLGNHDYHSNQEWEILNLFRERGILALEGESTILDIQGMSVGIMGIKGFGGGFFGACITEFGEPETKAFAQFARRQSEILRAGLEALDTDYRFALLHYSPIDATLKGEKKEIFPFLGSYLLAEAIDEAGADAVFHGHAHHGVERGVTPGGVPVRNVALPVIRHTYNVYTFEERAHAVHPLARSRHEAHASEEIARTRRS